MTENAGLAPFRPAASDAAGLERSPRVAPVRQAVRALARVEAVRLLRHPLTVAASLFLIGFWGAAWFTNDANHFPVLQDVDRDSDLGMMLLLGAAALIAANLAITRRYRHGTTDLDQVLLLPLRSRTLAHLLSLLPLAALGGVLTVARIGVLAVFTPAAGRPDLYELAIGPATVLLLGALGVLLGRLVRSTVVAPLTLLVLLATLVVLPLLTQGSPARWLQPVVADNDPALTAPVPAYLMARPTGAHLAYLLGLAGVCAVAALIAAGARGARVTVATVLALACATAGGIWQLAPTASSVTTARLAAMNHPSQHQTCRTLATVRYCAFPDFAGWIPAWRGVVQAVVAQVPADRRPAGLTIRQRLVVLDPHGGLEPDALIAAWRADDAAAGTPGAVMAGTRWGDSQSAADLAASVAYRLVAGGRDGTVACGGAGVLVIWLAAQAGAQANTGLHKLFAHPDGEDGSVSLGAFPGIAGVDVPAAEITVALAASQRPTADIAARVQQSWTTLTDPGTTAAQAAQILGVPAPAANASGRDCR